MSTMIEHKSELSATMRARFAQFMGALDDPAKEIVRVFDPLSKKQLDELELIREVSAKLQTKKQEDVKKVAETAAAADLGAESAEENYPKEKANPVM